MATGAHSDCVPWNGVRRDSVLRADVYTIDPELHACHTHVVGGIGAQSRRPRDRRTVRRRSESNCRSGCVRRAAAAANRRHHVDLNLGLRERAVVHTHLIDLALEVFPPDRVATNSQRHRRNLDVARDGRAPGCHAIDVEHQRGPVVRHRDVRVDIEGKRVRAVGIVRSAGYPNPSRRPRAVIGICGVE